MMFFRDRYKKFALTKHFAHTKTLSARTNALHVEKLFARRKMFAHTKNFCMYKKDFRTYNKFCTYKTCFSRTNKNFVCTCKNFLVRAKTPLYVSWVFSESLRSGSEVTCITLKTFPPPLLVTKTLIDRMFG